MMVFSDREVNSGAHFQTSRQLTVQLTDPSILTFVTWPFLFLKICHSNQWGR